MPTILGVDHGTRRLGLAVSDPDGVIATPSGTAEVRGDDAAVAAVVKAAAEAGAERIVVGLPVNMDGSEGGMAAKVRGFVAAVAAATGLPVETWDERLTTVMVEKALVAADLTRHKRRGVRDKLAAQAILQSYLDARAEREDLGTG
jgi:putative Holliday junction resolvase